MKKDVKRRKRHADDLEICRAKFYRMRSLANPHLLVWGTSALWRALCPSGIFPSRSRPHQLLAVLAAPLNLPTPVLPISGRENRPKPVPGHLSSNTWTPAHTVSPPSPFLADGLAKAASLPPARAPTCPLPRPTALSSPRARDFLLPKPWAPLGVLGMKLPLTSLSHPWGRTAA